VSALPHEVIYPILLGAIVILCGLWVRAHDIHRQWSTERINGHEKALAVLEHDYVGIREDLAEIKMLLGEHTKHDRKIHEALIRKLNLDVVED
jgi:hypothetical protein